MIICWYSVIHRITMSMYKLLVHDLKRVMSHTLIWFTCKSHANCMLVTCSWTAAGTFALRGGKCKCDDLSEPSTLVKRCVTTWCNHHWCQQCAHHLMRTTADSSVTDYHFSAEKSNCDYCISTRHQCVPVCAPEFCMSFTDYLQVPLNCNQSLAVILTQAEASSYWWCKCTYWRLCVCFSTGPESSDDCLCEVIWSSQGPTVVGCWRQPCHRGWCSNADEHSSAVHRGGSYCCKHAFRLQITDMLLIYTRSTWSCLSDLRRIRRTCLTLSLVTTWLRSSAALLLTMRLRMRRTLMCKKLSSSLRQHIEVHHSNFWNLLSCSQFLKLTLTNTLWVYLFCPAWLSSSCGVGCEYS